MNIPKINTYLKTHLQYTDYQIQVLRYFFCTVASEISKFFIMGSYFFFCNSGWEYLFAVCILWFLRFCSGGIHRKTYLGCLICSFLYLILAVQILPVIPMPLWLQILSMALAIPVSRRLGPAISPYRKHITPAQSRRYQKYQTVGLLIYLLFIIIAPASPLQKVGYWVIMIHILQLTLAKRR